jgi:hypothetical protein
MPPKLRAEIAALLQKRDFDGLIELYKKKKSVLRHLIAMTYDLEDLMSWRAMESIGAVTARMPADEAREVIQKVLWMMREESGNNAWSAPDILCEILKANPKPFHDIVPVLVSFHEEEFFRTGVLRAMARIAQQWPELIEPFADVAIGYLQAPEPPVRGYAALVLRALGKPFPGENLKANEATVVLYDGSSLTEKAVKDLL